MIKTYVCRYRKFGTEAWHTLSNLVGDGYAPETGHRYFVTHDGARIEIPVIEMEFHFSKERSEMMDEMKQRETNGN